MPDLPPPQDATEAALLTECWDTVLSYADLCTSGSGAATRLAREAFARGLREARDTGAALPRGTGRRPARLPHVPLLLTAVRTTAAAWESAGEGHLLDPELRLWLTSDQAARHTGPPPRRPLALRALRDLQEPDAALLWLAEVEALPLPVVARRLGLDPAGVAGELDEVRRLFRDRCRRAHLDAPLDAECARYARLLDAVTRTPATEIPADLSRHLARCVTCAEAAACLRPHGGGPAAALAGGVLGWGGPAYLERRRRAAEARRGPGRPDHDHDHDPEERGTPQPRVLRNGLLVAAVLVSALALAVTLMPIDNTGERAAPPADTTDRQPVADPHPSASVPPAPRPGDPTSATRTPTRPAAPATGRDRRTPSPATAPQAAPARTSRAPAPARTEPPACRVSYDLAGQWPDGFQATVTVHTDRALDDWRVAWTFPDGQRVNQMWDATYAQHGSRVTARAADYNRTVPADGTLSFGFLASWQDRNAPAHDFTLDGRPCAVAGPAE
ncbi:cellulose-binding domain-containing protein [Streptomyces sp. JB150]|uniref:cellulose-binding domain-containing protein n=1 Tax=Streptomyces sp. JB150 TaxID=2714844 RepID=UPI00140BFC66|nr:cellulose-binding domain-containing protein [Streptomyces sp. JB150]QIJ65415.1 cellulose-binding protein [Streptomyces sp. JB150]